MATRNRSKDFLNLRERTKGSGGVRGAGSKKKGKHASLLGDDGSADADQVRIQGSFLFVFPHRDLLAFIPHFLEVGLSHTLPPEWVDVVESIQRDVHEVKDKSRKMGFWFEGEILIVSLFFCSKRIAKDAHPPSESYFQRSRG